jgi:hypothetical protein
MAPRQSVIDPRVLIASKARELGRHGRAEAGEA